MLGTLIFGFALSVLLLLVINLGARWYISDVYLSEDNVAKRAKEYETDLQKYVSDNYLTVDDADKIAEWAQDNKYLYVLIYKDNELWYDSGAEQEKIEENKDNDGKNPSDSVENGEKPDTDGSGDSEMENGGESQDSEKTEDKKENAYQGAGITVRPPTREELMAAALDNDSCSIKTADGGVLLASMADYTEYLYYDITNIVSWLVALATFFITMWVHFYGITKRISMLGKEITLVAEGDTEHAIAAKGTDEITRLSMDVEYMRVSMLDTLQRQKSALESNKDLITAMSHDIRTPLTVLLGYLDIMKSNAEEGEMKNYIEASENTALRLKKLSDDMFGYFLVYGGDIEVDVQECNARTLVEQMLSGHIFLLREQGYHIEYNFEDKDAEFLSDVVMVTDPPQLMRIVENIFSNVIKYADKEKPITVFVDSFVDEMTIKVVNYPSLNPDKAQKNGIGLRSCMKLANAMDVRFSYEERDGVFTSDLYVPILPKIEYSASTAEETEEEKKGFAVWLSSVSEKLRSAASSCASFFVSTFAKVKKLFSKKK